MATFYDDWLHYWEEEKEERARSRKFIHEEDLEWVRTQQDYRAALLCSRENGFATVGAVMLGEIPKGWHTGKHSHGEEAIFIIEGDGFSVIDGQRYEWDKGSCVFVPFGAIHQHFNAGETSVRYLSAMALALERFAGVAKVAQCGEASETSMRGAEAIPMAESEVHPQYGRIVLRFKDAPISSGSGVARKLAERKDDYALSRAKEMRTAGLPGHRAKVIDLMSPESEFKSREVYITAVLIDEPGKHSGKHAHMEALLYVLQGEGESIIDGEKVLWKKGSLLQVQGPQTVHQHFNTGSIEAHHLRIHFGLRSLLLQPAAVATFPYLYYEYSSY